MSRQASIERNTAETQIKLKLALDGSGSAKIETGIAFFDHMLTLFSKHGLFDLEVIAKGDLDVDFHHTVEDVGIVLGQAFLKALGDKQGITRYGSSYVPMDETLARVVVDLSGRSYLVYHVPPAVEAIGNFSFQLVEEFLRAFSANMAMNLHVEILYGRDAHHMAEAIFKALAKALDHAVRIDGRIKGVPSTKGVL
ncbi:MAG: imidazoleglycerol-phosphate dehydratase HisB [Chthoniobacterales bacterium]